MNFRVEIEQEEDGRWIEEVLNCQFSTAKRAANIPSKIL
jgi:hypothetical protein